MAPKAIEAFEPILNPLQTALLKRIEIAFRSAVPHAAAKDYGVFVGEIVDLVKTYDRHRTEQIQMLERLLLDRSKVEAGLVILRNNGDRLDNAAAQGGEGTFRAQPADPLNHAGEPEGQAS